MQIDMHYYGTYCLARNAGLTKEAARVIATSAQFVDDNAQKNAILLDDASYCAVEATAHHTTSVKNINPDDQRQVWVPFHFLPGNEGGSFTEQLVCRKDSEIAQQLRDHHIAQSERPYYLELVGVMAHVYADTFSHYGFSGVSSRKNKVVNDSFHFDEINEETKKYLFGKADSFFKKFGNQLLDNIKSKAAESLSGALGHGSVLTYPDQPYLKWKFEYENGKSSGWRNNQETFLEYAEKIHKAFYEVSKKVDKQHQDVAAYRDWDDFKNEISSILKYDGKKDKRTEKWQESADSGRLFNSMESIPEYKDWNEGFEDLASGQSNKAMEHPTYHFYQAASYHRWYVLRDLLPKHGLMVR